MADDVSSFEYLNGDNVFYRRRAGTGAAVDDVLQDGMWRPYAGDAFAAGTNSDRCEDPLAGRRAPARRPREAVLAKAKLILVPQRAR